MTGREGLAELIRRQPGCQTVPADKAYLRHVQFFEEIEHVSSAGEVTPVTKDGPGIGETLAAAG
jgi:hypothetical protein